MCYILRDQIHLIIDQKIFFTEIQNCGGNFNNLLR